MIISTLAILNLVLGIYFLNVGDSLPAILNLTIAGLLFLAWKKV